MPTNGNYVTRAELTAHLTPMREDITEIKSDVKTLLEAQAQSHAIKDFFTHFTTLGTMFGSSILGALAAHFIR